MLVLLRCDPDCYSVEILCREGDVYSILSCRASHIFKVIVVVDVMVLCLGCYLLVKQVLG